MFAPFNEYTSITVLQNFKNFKSAMFNKYITLKEYLIILYQFIVTTTKWFFFNK